MCLSSSDNDASRRFFPPPAAVDFHPAAAASDELDALFVSHKSPRGGIHFPRMMIMRNGEEPARAGGRRGLFRAGSQIRLF